MNEIDKSKPYGELWIDTSGDAHFQCHTSNEDFEATRLAIEKFIAVLQRQVDTAAACPFWVEAAS